jgi:CheY-like chemotaxis protein
VLFQSWRPHFIWMDLRLPVLSGLEAAKRIRELEGGREVKIVALTASAFASQREEVLAEGFDGFLRKPYRSREIFECMARELGVRYHYAATPDHRLVNPPGRMRREDIQALPAELRHELEGAVMSLESDRIAAAVTRIFESNATLGTTLRRLTARYEYTPVLDALRQGLTDRRASSGAR